MTRALDDHGTAQQAIDFLLTTPQQAPGEETSFLRCWSEGDLHEWPEFYVWLDTQPQPRPGLFKRLLEFLR